MKSDTPRLSGSVGPRWLAFLLILAGGGSCHHHHDDDCYYHYHGGSHHYHGDCDDHGVVIVFVTDNPVADLEALYVTITEVVFLTDEEERHVLYSSQGGQRVDLLSLRGQGESRLHELLLGEAALPAGRYPAIRLSVEEPALVLRSGEVVHSSQIELDGDGRLDLALSPALHVTPDERVVLVLDFDVERTVMREDPQERWRLRPLVRTKALYEEIVADISGKIVETDRVARVLALELAEDRGTMEVVVGEGAFVFGRDLRAMDFAAIEAGAPATVRGSFHRAWAELEAHVVIQGDTVRVQGTVARRRTPRGGSRWSIEVTPDPAAARGSSSRDFLVTEETLISFDRLLPAREADLREGAQAVVVGSSSGSAHNALLVDLRREARRGTVVEIVESESHVEVGILDDQGEGAAYRLSPNVRVFAGDRELQLSDVELGAEVTIHGSWANTAVAETLILEPRRLAGVVRAVDAHSGVLVMTVGNSDETVRVARDAEVLLLEAMEGVLHQSALRFEEIDAGMRVEVDGGSGPGSPSRFLIVMPPRP